GGGELVHEPVAGQPELAIVALRQLPAILLAPVDEVVHLHRVRLVLEEASEDRRVVAAHRDESVELGELARQIAKRRDESPAVVERREYLAEEAADVVLRLEVKQR